MPKLPIIKAKELIQVLNKLGFFKFHQVGSHAQFKHPDGRKIKCLFTRAKKSVKRH